MKIHDNDRDTASQPKGWHKRGYLPHYDPGAVTQLVTFRLIDSFPSSCLTDWAEELTNMSPAQAECERRQRIEDYLDRGHGSVWLLRPEVAELVSRTLLHFDGVHYSIHAWCVMPNHVHVLITPFSGSGLDQIVHSWKSYTVNKANKSLGGSGPFWQREYFDRYIRNEQHFLTAVSYVKYNPVKAGLCQCPAQWTYSSAFKSCRYT